ncbi:MAG: tetratricopeptide repeat protein, partial [Anaerolineales bacterium]
YLEYKRHGDAADVFSRAIASVPDDFVAHVGMSIIYDEANKLDEAIWHMERAFETQPSNPAIQGELQRLYGRREGVQPPRIRMTRGALAHMYVQGELYPQAISEIRSVLKEDPGRVDMQVLLARAYYRSGLKNDAADVASSLLRTNPYCLDANRVLLEILGPDHPDSVQAYRQRVVELDPYAAQVAGSIFLANEVPDAAVSLEKLDWNGQPVGMQADWASTQAISLESGRGADEQPEWLTGAFGGAAAAASSQPFDAFGGAPSQPEPVPGFDMATPSARPAEPVDEIPDFLRAAGWGQSTGAFDESKPAFADEGPVSGDQPIEQGDLPDWIKAMAPEPPAEAPAQEEDLPDWINKIGTSALPVPSESSSQPSEPAAQPADGQPNWLKQFAASEEPAAPVAGDQPDWLREFESKSEAPASASNEFDFLNQLGSQPEAASAAQPSDDFDFLKQLDGQPETTPAVRPTDDFDFLNELKEESAQPAPSTPGLPSVDNLGTSQAERDDSFAWLENLAAKQGATEGLLTKPEERLEKEPEWVQQAKTLGAQPQETPPAQPPRAEEPPARAKELGKSEQERDDSFAWLENLAAKQGATEGLLTKPEERLEKEPEWVQQAKTLGAQPQETPSAERARAEELPVSAEELGKSEQERDDSFAWLENLAAKQGATEGLLTKPEERLEKEPEWVKQAKDLSPQQPPAVEPPPALDDTAAWLRSLDQEEAAPAPVSDDTAMWLKNIDQPEEILPEPAQAEPAGDLPAWMQEIPAEEPPAAGATVAVPAQEAADETAWMRSLAEPAAEAPAETAPKVETGSLPSWLRGLDEETTQESVSASQGDLPVWLRDESGETVAEPAKVEPTRPTDWRPAETSQPEQAAAPELVAQAPQPEPQVPPEKPAPPVEKPKKPAASPKPEPYREPATRSREPGVPGMAVDSILGQARNELARSNIPGALETYGRLIKKGRFLDEVIYDLRDALYRYPVEVSIWQALGDAYMRANRLQDALDAYTKAEELLR